MTATAAAPPVRTFQPTRRIVGREIHGDRIALELECGHVADLPANDVCISLRCDACPPVLHG